MASLMKNIKIIQNSVSLEEARGRVFDFYKMTCRFIPQIMEIYNLQDVVNPHHLRSTVAAEIRKNAHVTDPKVIDLMLFKGMEELHNVVNHSKQRHHIIGQYVVGGEHAHNQDLGTKDEGASKFLKNFYESNYS
ncbi:hypothetical protein ACFE04_000927 [Oxalis oulophora]